MVQFVQKECIVGLAFRSYTIFLETIIIFSISWVPMLRIWGIRNNSIHTKRLACINTSLADRPVFAKRVSTTSIDVAWTDATHDEIHTSQVVGVFLQLLSIVFHMVLILNMASNTLTNGKQQ